METLLKPLKEILLAIMDFFHYIKEYDKEFYRREPGDVQALIANSRGEMTIQVTRETSYLAGALPVVLFAPNDLAAKYFNFINSFLPNVIPRYTWDVSVDNTTGDILITYTNLHNPPGRQHDIIRIHAVGNVAYSTFVQSINTSFFKSKLIMYGIDQPFYADAQFEEDFNYGYSTSIQGLQSFNIWRLNARILPSDGATGRISVMFPEKKINAEFGFVQQIVPTAGATDAPVINEYTIFMSEEIKTDAIANHAK